MKYVKTTCPLCHKETILEMSDEQYDLLMSTNGFIQDIFPNWSPAKREMLMTGICEKCWNNSFDCDEY